VAENTILITLGDPNGLGPELVGRWLSRQPAVPERLVLIGPERAMGFHSGRLGLGLSWKRLETLGDEGPGLYLIEPEGLENFSLQPGHFSASGGLAAGLSLSLACDLLQNHSAQTLVTCPLNKAGLQEAGFDFPGHTEFLAKRAGLGPDEVCMHLYGPKLRVSLVTTHFPISLVPKLITREKILLCLRLTEAFLRDMGLSGPMAVCGLNPHAGEQGLIGCEDEEIVRPAVEEAKEQGLDVEGPLPGDTAFFRAFRGEFAAVLAMYHDQGLAPLKLVHFGQAVNVTLGLPFVRTSVDHGTGYELVGKGLADLGSFLAALDVARRLSKARA
jgi:4-hydroxythreonine-4-phosphate dehydrogenase